MLFTVYKVRPAAVDSATPYRSYFKRCELGTTTIHTHLFATCDNGKCFKGGPDAGQCEPSQYDRRTLLFTIGAPMAGIQCDRLAISWHYR